MHGNGFFGKLNGMVIASIDLKDGHVVQLKNGKDLVLQRDDADNLIAEFNRYGEVAVIDLDAAMRNTDEKGNTKNTELLKSLLRKGNIRVGGGIRTVKKARELISLGAEKVIIGSAAWNTERKDGDRCHCRVTLVFRVPHKQIIAPRSLRRV